MLKVYLSSLAERKLTLLLDQLETSWSKKVRDSFLENILSSFQRIAQHPEMYPDAKSYPNLYKCVLTEQTSYYYRIHFDEIEVITVIDNRQDPEEIALEVKKFLQK